MANYLITGYWGAPHVTAENDRGLNAGTFGSGRYVLDVGQKLKAEYIGNNIVRLYDGKLVDRGAAAGIPAGEYIDLPIANTGQGMNRNDLIVFQYMRDGSTLVESGDFIVVQGTEVGTTPQDPTLTQGDLLSGNVAIDQMPLWRVPVSSGAVSAPVQLFELVHSLKSITPSDIGAVPTTRKVNGKALSGDITLSAKDVSAVPTTRTVNKKALSADITLSATDLGAVPTTRKVNGKALSGDITLSATDVNALSASAGTALEPLTDMNTIKTPGTYRVPDGTVAGTITNLPYVAGSSIVDVRTGGFSGSIVQIQYATASQWVPMYVRQFNGTTWSDWECFVRSVNGVTPSKTNGEVTLTPADIGAVPTTRKVNGKALSGDITLSATDVSAVPTTRKVNGRALSGDITLQASDIADAVPTTRTVNKKALSSNITLEPADIATPESVSLTWASVVDSAGDTSYTIRYNPFTKTCFFRAVVEVGSALTAGTTYDVATISAHKSSYGTALAVFSSKQCKAMINSEGIIRLRAEEAIPKGYVAYISGFWFA